jgi:hypothetical protein
MMGHQAQLTMAVLPDIRGMNMYRLSSRQKRKHDQQYDCHCLGKPAELRFSLHVYEITFRSERDVSVSEEIDGSDQEDRCSPVWS